jgi:hypothetical protein
LKKFIYASPCLKMFLSFESTHQEATHNLKVCYTAVQRLLDEIKEKEGKIKTILNNR